MDKYHKDMVREALGPIEKTTIPPLDEPTKSLDFDAGSYDPSQHPECERALSEAEDFAGRLAGFPRHGKWLTLLGKCGTGKTHLARCIYLAARKKYGPEAMFWRWGGIVDHLHKGSYEIIAYLAARKFLVIDDLGAGRESEMTKAKAVDLAEQRLSKWTVWTSNLLINDLGELLDARIASRMVRDGNRIVQFREAPDYGISHYEK